MKSLLYSAISILILSYFNSFGQFNEDFSDNDLLINPQWIGDVTKFNTIDGKLHSNSNITSDQFYISTKNKSVLETEWKISLNCDFKTSSANYIDIFLASDSVNPSKANHAYFIRVGDTKDDISMYRLYDGLTTQLTNGTEKKTEKKKMSIHVIHQSNKSGIIYPHQFIALTIDTNQIKFDYPNSKELLQILKMPPMNNTSGDLSLYQSGVLLDSVLYHEDQHFQLLSDYNGISLERIIFEGNGYDPNNWHSASSVEGYATPGYENSQYINTPKSMNQFELTSSIISPDGDGFEDFLTLNYHMNNLGYVLNGYIYDLTGFQVHHPYNNVTLGNKGSLKWNGLDSKGVKLPIGNYILLIEAFNETGKIIKKKIAFGITGIF